METLLLTFDDNYDNLLEDNKGEEKAMVIVCRRH